MNVAGTEEDIFKSFIIEKSSTITGCRCVQPAYVLRTKHKLLSLAVELFSAEYWDKHWLGLSVPETIPTII